MTFTRKQAEEIIRTDDFLNEGLSCVLDDYITWPDDLELQNGRYLVVALTNSQEGYRDWTVEIMSCQSKSEVSEICGEAFKHSGTRYGFKVYVFDSKGRALGVAVDNVRLHTL